MTTMSISFAVFNTLFIRTNDILEQQNTSAICETYAIYSITKVIRLQLGVMHVEPP